MTKKTFVALATVGLIIIVAEMLTLTGALPADRFFASLRSPRTSVELGSFELTSVAPTCVGEIPQVALTWTESDNAEDYIIERQYPWGTWEEVGDATGLSFTDATYETGYDVGTWAYRVKAQSGRTKLYSSAQTVAIPSCAVVVPTTPTSTVTSTEPEPPVTPPTTEPTSTPPVSEPTTTPTSTPPTGGTGSTSTSTPTSTPSTGGGTTTPTTTPTSTTPATPTSTASTSSPQVPTSTPPVSISGNLIQNPSLETDADSNGTPDQWFRNYWGSNRSVFSYPVSGSDGADAAKVTVSSYRSGDAKWYFADVPITSGLQYRFTDQYLSTAQSQVVARYTKSGGSFSYATLATLPATSVWKTFDVIFTPLSGSVSMTVFHLLARNGSLTTDAYGLTQNSAATPTSTPVAPTLTFTASPTSLVGSGSSNLTWSATNASSCTASGSWSGTKNTSGSQTVSLSQTSTYTLMCTGAGGSVTRTASVSVSTPPTPTSTPTSTPPTSTSTKLVWGAYVAGTVADAAAFESLVGKQMNMEAIFVGWGSDGSFPSEYGPSVRDKGKTLIIFWEPYGTTPDIINAGQSDTYIQQFAAAAKSYAGPIILAPLHEMNGDWDPWDGPVGNNTPAKVIATWKHIHGFFSAATNVKFAWAVNNVSVPDTAANAIGAYYPGDAYVDYVAVDGFNFGNPWESFSSVFSSALSTLGGYGKPIYILSMASAAGSQKAAWITDAFTVQIPKYPKIAGWAWFNENKEENWLVNSDANSLAAFKAILP
jgi:hypothetical protein